MNFSDYYTVWLGMMGLLGVGLLYIAYAGERNLKKTSKKSK